MGSLDELETDLSRLVKVGTDDKGSLKFVVRGSENWMRVRHVQRRDIDCEFIDISLPSSHTDVSLVFLPHIYGTTQDLKH